jgi:uncharacterized membrane protein YgdD (TMEM256/DUF423 family)
MHRSFLSIGFILGFAGVAAGAFGAHALGDALGPDRIRTFETAVRYQLFHALALFGIGLASARWPVRGWKGTGALMTAGTVLFSGSLYALSLLDVAIFGAVAPIGGVSLLAGWLLGLATAWRLPLESFDGR